MSEVIGYTATFEGYHQMPEFGRTAYIDPRTRRVFAPAALGDHEGRVAILAAFDAVPLVQSDGHLYVPADWLAKTFPEAASACARLTRIVLEAHDAEEGK